MQEYRRCGRPPRAARTDIMDPLPDRLLLVIGVTGHRDLRDQDVPTLEREICSDHRAAAARLSATAMSRRRSSCCHRSPKGLTAGGTGALAHGARLVAPMPMPIEEYRRDFEPGLKAGNAAEFDAFAGASKSRRRWLPFHARIRWPLFARTPASVRSNIGRPAVHCSACQCSDCVVGPVMAAQCARGGTAERWLHSSGAAFRSTSGLGRAALMRPKIGR